MDGRRTNGFQTPKHTLQLATWIVFGVLVVEFGVIVAPIAAPAEPILWAVVGCFVVSAGLTFGLAWVCTAADPSDPLAKKVWLGQDETGDYRTPEDPGQVDGKKTVFCQLCMCYVQEGCKHCMACNRCVRGFDHHCVFLNNCVHGGTYKAFMGLLTAVMVTTATSAGVNTWIAVDALSDDQGVVMSQARSSFGSMDRYALASVSLFVCFLAILTFLAVGHLWGFHLMLIHKGMTTYEHILQMRDKAAAKQQSKIAKQQAKAEEQANTNTDSDSESPPRRFGRKRPGQGGAENGLQMVEIKSGGPEEQPNAATATAEGNQVGQTLNGKPLIMAVSSVIHDDDQTPL